MTTPLTPEGVDNRPCQDCGGDAFSWFAPHELWNLVMGGPNAKDDPGGILCPNCFIARATAVGMNPSAWALSIAES